MPRSDGLDTQPVSPRTADCCGILGPEPKWKRPSPHSVSTTIDRLEAIIAGDDLIATFVRVDQSAVLASAGETARPMEMLIFENRELSMRMIRVRPEAAFELPIRALAWEDDGGSVWLRVPDPDQLDRAARLQGGDGVIADIHRILGGILDAVLASDPL